MDRLGEVPQRHDVNMDADCRCRNASWPPSFQSGLATEAQASTELILLHQSCTNCAAFRNWSIASRLDVAFADCHSFLSSLGLQVPSPKM